MAATQMQLIDALRSNPGNLTLNVEIAGKYYAVQRVQVILLTDYTEQPAKESRQLILHIKEK